MNGGPWPCGMRLRRCCGVRPPPGLLSTLFHDQLNIRSAAKIFTFTVGGAKLPPSNTGFSSDACVTRACERELLRLQKLFSFPILVTELLYFAILCSQEQMGSLFCASPLFLTRRFWRLIPAIVVESAVCFVDSQATGRKGT